MYIEIPACERCAPYDGVWAEAPSGALKRCDCPRGRALLAAETKALPEKVEQKISDKCANLYMEMMSQINYFPASAVVRADIADEIAQLCHSPEDAKWLARRMKRLYREWPDPNEMRRVFCRDRKPLDGEYPDEGSTVYPDGIPADPRAPRRELPAPQPREIAKVNPRAPVAIADPVAREIRDSAVRKVEARGTLPPIRRIVPRLNEPDDQALHRAFTEDLARPVPKPRLPTEDEIAEIKRKQAEAAKEDATRDILTKGNSA